MTEPKNPDNQPPIPTADPRDIIIGIRHSLAASNAWNWGNTSLEFTSSPDDTAPGHDADPGPEPG
jgi:hypothetical protein